MDDDLKRQKADAVNQQVEGTAQNVGGKVKEAWGALTGDTSDKVEGQKDQLVGDAKKKIGEIRGDVADKLDR